MKESELSPLFNPCYISVTYHIVVQLELIWQNRIQVFAFHVANRIHNPQLFISFVAILWRYYIRKAP